ncbi:hypothetical protein GCM10009736_43360 [Actinomadura bangladeshensis]
MVLGPSPSIAATMCLLTAFFAPRTVTSPRSGPDGSIRQSFSVTRAAYGVRAGPQPNSPQPRHALPADDLRPDAGLRLPAPHTPPLRHRSDDHQPAPALVLEFTPDEWTTFLTRVKRGTVS